MRRRESGNLAVEYLRSIALRVRVVPHLQSFDQIQFVMSCTLQCNLSIDLRFKDRFIERFGILPINYCTINVYGCEYSVSRIITQFLLAFELSKRLLNCGVISMFSSTNYVQLNDGPMEEFSNSP